MPIRMEQDPEQPRRSNNSGQGRNTGGGGLANLLQFAPLLLGFLFKKPKLLLLVLAGVAIWYFMSGGCNDLASEGDLSGGSEA